jgi:hypothetical protein
LEVPYQCVLYLLFPAISKKNLISTHPNAESLVGLREELLETEISKRRGKGTRYALIPFNDADISPGERKSLSNTRPCPSRQVQQGVRGYPIVAASRLLETAKAHKQGLLWGVPSAPVPTRSRSQSFQQSAELNAKFLDGQPQSDLFRQPEPFRCQTSSARNQPSGSRRPPPSTSWIKRQLCSRRRRP